MNWKRFLVAVFAALLLLPGVALAQSTVTGAINGTVTDPSGAVISGASVTLTSTATGESFTTQSNTTGSYSFGLVKPGRYGLTVSQQGFKQVSEPVDVELGQVGQYNIKMELGSGSITVEVTGQGALLQTENANITTSIEATQIENLPNPGGDLTNIAQTAPGVTMNSTGGYGNFSAFGLPGTANLFTINGNDYNDPFLNLNNSGASNLLLGSNEIQEVAVVSNAYTGQYGRQAGAQIDYATKSGGNSFHGDAVYFFNSGGMNASDFFNGYSHEVNNQWAAALGGPVVKDKLFFFVNTEGLRYSLAAGSGAVGYPTPEFQSYVLSQVALQPTASTALPFYQNIFNLYQGSAGYASAISAAGVALAGPGSCGSLNGKGITSQGVTDACVGQSFATSPNGNKEWLLSGRVDYNYNDNNKVYGRFKIDRGTQPTYSDPINPAFNDDSVQPQDEGQLNFTHIFSPTIVNNFVGSVLWYSAIFNSVNLPKAFETFPGLFSLNDIGLYPIGQGSGFDPFFSLFPQGRNVTQWQLVDDLSISRGSHSFKMGVNFRRDDVSDYTASEGLFPAISVSGSDFATDNFNGANGDFLGQQFATHTRQPLAFYSFGLYFQDEWRVSSKLKLTMALRADRNSGGACQSNCGAAPFGAFADISHDPNAPFNQITNAGTHSILPDVERVVFQPRFGIAWTPWGDKTVIRAGVGLFSDLYPGTILDRFTTNFPEVTTYSFNAPSNFAFTDPNSATNGVLACNTGFQTAYAGGQNLAAFNAANKNCLGQLPGYNSVGKLLNPKYLEWNVEIQRTLDSATVLSVNYVGNKGYDDLINNPYLNSNDAGNYGGLPSTAPDLRVTNVTELQNTGTNNYNGITLSLQRTFSHGFLGRVNYTYSHELDDTSNGGILPYFGSGSILNQINPFSLRSLNYSDGDYDLRHSLTANYVYTMPFHSANRLMDLAIGGWVLSGTFYYHTGFPFSPTDNAEQNALNVTNANLANVTVLAAPLPGTPRNCTSPTTSCFTTADFATASDFGTVPRNSFRGPNYFNTDFSLRKNFRLTERFGLELGANAYNVLNHPNFSNPITNNTNPSFGSITSTVSPATTPYGAFVGSLADPRIIQLIAKLNF
jgi:Carboxypeptidase regulatory-like domain/TonB-dependent Receptor Plug Domain/TonB dependent receptor